MDKKETLAWLGLIVVAGVISEIIAETALRHVIYPDRDRERPPTEYGPLLI